MSNDYCRPDSLQQRRDSVGDYAGIIGDAGYSVAQKLAERRGGKLRIGIKLKWPRPHAIGEKGQFVTEINRGVGDDLGPFKVAQAPAEGRDT